MPHETFILDELLNKKMAKENHSENIEFKLLQNISRSYIFSPLGSLTHKPCTLCCFW